MGIPGMAGPSRSQLDRIGKLLDEAGTMREFERWVRAASNLRAGRPSFDVLDGALIEAARKASKASGVPISTLLRAGAMMGAGQGASADSKVRRLQRKARLNRI